MHDRFTRHAPSNAFLSSKKAGMISSIVIFIVSIVLAKQQLSWLRNETNETIPVLATLRGSTSRSGSRKRRRRRRRKKKKKEEKFRRRVSFAGVIVARDVEMHAPYEEQRRPSTVFDSFHPAYMFLSYVTIKTSGDTRRYRFLREQG